MRDWALKDLAGCISFAFVSPQETIALILLEGDPEMNLSLVDASWYCRISKLSFRAERLQKGCFQPLLLHEVFSKGMGREVDGFGGYQHSA